MRLVPNPITMRSLYRMPDRGPRLQKYARVPGRPENLSLAALLRRKFNRIFFPCFFTAPLPILALMCVFERQVDTVLRIFGYSNEFVSSFPFIKALYLNIAYTEGLERIDIGYFHVADAALWVSIIAWMIWLIVAIVLLNEYDRFLQRVFSTVALSKFGGSRLLVNTVMLLVLPACLLAAHIIAQPKLMTSPEIFLALKYIPGVFFFLIAASYYYGVVLSSVSILFLIWQLFRLFRRNRPETVHRSDSSKEKDAAR
jgi:hypothetical protein